MKKQKVKPKITVAAREHDLKRGVDYIGACVVFFCHDGKGNFLLHKRSKNCRDEQGRWDCGGGAMEFGETFEDAVRREVKEEYRANVADVRYLGTQNIVRAGSNGTTHWLANVFACRVDPAQIQNGDPHYIDEIGWFPLHKLPRPIHSSIPKDIALLKKHFKEE